MKLYIKILANMDKSFNIESEENNTVQLLKSQIMTKTAESPKSLRLLYKGNEMNDNKKLSEYSIKDGDTIYLIYKNNLYNNKEYKYI